jgi:hypothetical protein
MCNSSLSSKLIIFSVTVQFQIEEFLVTSVSFNLRNILLKYFRFLLQYPVYKCLNVLVIVNVMGLILCKYNYMCACVLTLIVCDKCGVQSGYYYVLCDVDHVFPVEYQTVMYIECRINQKTQVNILCFTLLVFIHISIHICVSFHVQLHVLHLHHLQ